MGDVKTYDSKLVIINFFGVPLTGYADGEFCSVVSSSERFTKQSGADGEITRSKSNDNTSEITVTLKQSSLSNNYLSGILELDRIANNGKGPFSIVDLSGTTLMEWPQAWIRQPPDQSFGKENGDRAWVFDTGQPLIESIGGNL